MRKHNLLGKTIATALTSTVLTTASLSANAQNTQYISGTTSSVNPVSQSSLTALNGVYSFTTSTSIFSWDGHNNTASSTLGYGWGHNADWFVFNMSSTENLDIKVTSSAANFNPAFTLYSTTGYTDPIGVSGLGHTFSQTSTGSDTGWLADPNQGGATGVVGYANSGPTGWTNAVGQVVTAGTGGTLNLEQGLAELTINSLAAGKYLLVVGSDYACGSFNGNSLAACPASNTGAYTLTITPNAVPVPAAAWLFGSALTGLGFSVRRKKSA